MTITVGRDGSNTRGENSLTGQLVDRCGQLAAHAALGCGTKMSSKSPIVSAGRSGARARDVSMERLARDEAVRRMSEVLNAEEPRHFQRMPGNTVAGEAIPRG